MMNGQQYAEAAPLLRIQPDEGDAFESNMRRRISLFRFRSTAKKTRNHLRRWATLYLCALFIFVIDVPAFMGEAVRIRMYELGICRNYYGHVDPSVIDSNGNVKEELCKTRVIQGQLAEFTGIQSTLNELLGVVVVVPYGMLADVYGRKVIIALCLIGIVLGHIWTAIVMILYRVFPMRAAFASTAFHIIGGGPATMLPVMLAMIADYATGDIRTQAFFYISAVSLISELVTPPIGSILSRAIGPHLTFLVALPFALIGLIVLVFIPEPVKPIRPESNPTSIKEKFGSMKTHFQSNIMPMLSRPLLFIALMALVVNRLSRPILALLLQYTSAKFHWKLEQSNYLISLQAALQLLLFLLILPHIQKRLVGKNAPQVADLKFSRGSVVFLGAGMLVMGISFHPPGFIFGLCVYVMGGGYVHAMRSYLTSLVPSDEAGFLYTLIAIFDGVGSLITTPLLAISLSKGIELGGLLTGLPFFIVTILYFLSALITWNLPVAKHRL